MMVLNKNFIDDVVEWDVENWKHALLFWETQLPDTKATLKCLELGGRRGGGTLWLASKGHDVTCSDLENPEVIAKQLHTKYQLPGSIRYESINAIDIPYTNEFDIIVIKSIIGGVSHSGQDELKQRLIDECYHALKPGGRLMFAENLESSRLHRFARRKFVKWGSNWNYLKIDTVSDLFSEWTFHRYQTIGFFAAFGRSEKQRSFLGKVDAFLRPFIPGKMRYIVYGVAIK
ncbi:class I SAM-dependent methyltransferase [Crocinitomicaceae bacterium CZZ-1]|uniref:Class I SAM-dependent methyltransferase n=1 Tax=Taishania pollutisoli TaxID=2766479 RepID=A0A8J6TT16_9FLAO|nr:class I SAM-dependent methyltransferase [Taishania pollutisoli]MBC9812682.1 class I SAM-dependent methyltransferase [Taishania pollutisoli]MBX2949162.1 class I SAM-dependent methyltransferase [Crocinitomicaceae bacterium]NGF75906.1 class I SAM-dependent methyltransferase [Fluviicola sp. SGL-29]